MKDLPALDRALIRHGLRRCADLPGVTLEAVVDDGMLHHPYGCRDPHRARRRGLREAAQHFTLTAALETPRCRACEPDLGQLGSSAWAEVRALLRLSEAVTAGHRFLAKPAAQRGAVRSVTQKIDRASNRLPRACGLFDTQRDQLRGTAATILTQLAGTTNDDHARQRAAEKLQRLATRNGARRHKTLSAERVLLGVTGIRRCANEVIDLLNALRVAHLESDRDAAVVCLVPRWAADELLQMLRHGHANPYAEVVALPQRAGTDLSQEAVVAAAETWLAHAAQPASPLSDLATCLAGAVEEETPATPGALAG